MLSRRQPKTSSRRSNMRRRESTSRDRHEHRGRRLGPTEIAEDLAGDEALEAADDLELGFALSRAAADVSEGGRMAAHSDDDHAIESRIGLPITAAVKPMSDGLTAG